MLSSRVPSRPGLSASDRIRSALARVKAQPMSTVALQTDEWRKALAQGIQRAGSGATLSPVRIEKDLGNNLGKLILAAVHPLKDSRPGNGGLRLWNYVNADAAHKEAQVGGSYNYAQI